MNRAGRLARHSAVAAHLGALSDRKLATWLEGTAPTGSGIGGTTATLGVDGVPVFVKEVPLTDLERRPAHVRSTVNLFQLPTFYQYGIGSAGFGAWRELAAHLVTTRWVLENRSQGFPLLHHWRVLPQPPRPSTDDSAAEVDQAVAFWEQSPAVRARLEAIAGCSASLVLFSEHIPHNVQTWLSAQAAVGGTAAASAYAMVERDLATGTAC
ncbi:MAG: hypothetical protein ACRDT4_16770 [Micromonosporaceae bacterium]